MTGLPRNTILIGDARSRLAELPPESVDCVITSPPYFAARDYGQREQIGHEPDIQRWVEELRIVLAGVARVLKPTGALWLNLGDGYARHSSEGALTKSLLLAPERVALALSADGWTLRNKVIWSKTNPMPSSVRDRLTCTYEVVYFITRTPRYYFNLDAIREPLRSTKPQGASAPVRSYPPRGAGAPLRAGSLANENHGLSRLKAAGIAGHPKGKNPGDVWRLATASFHGQHFATFPLSLIERPLLATCPKTICRACGQPVDIVPCTCGTTDTRPGVVLDPFFGAGTVGLAAEQHGRDWLGVELSPTYAALADQRLASARTAHATNTRKEVPHGSGTTTRTTR